MHQNHPRRQGTGAFRLCCVLDAEYVDIETPSTAVLIDWLISGRIKDQALLAPKESTYPRLLLVYQEGYGISLLFMQETNDLFLCADSEIGPPIVRVFIPPQTLELWPEALFVPASAAEAAVEYVLRCGQPSPALHWIGAGDFPRGEP